MALEFTKFARRPFVIEAIEITAENIEEIVKVSGIGVMGKTKSGTPFIKVNPNLVPHVMRVYPGFWFTKLSDGQIRCYAKAVFRRQFIKFDEKTETMLIPLMKDEIKKPAEVVQENVFDPPKDEQTIENILPGGTYTPGRVNHPAEKHLVTNELHLAKPTGEKTEGEDEGELNPELKDLIDTTAPRTSE